MENNASEFHPIIQVVNDCLKEYLEISAKGQESVVSQFPAKEVASKLHIKEWLQNGGLDASNVVGLVQTYLEHSQHMHHPKYIGHQVASHHLASGIADFIHGAINNPMAIYEMGPSAAVIERVMVNWMLSKVGWLPSGDIYDFDYDEAKGDGVFTHGGSMANLTALLAARAAVAPEAWDEGTPQDLVLIAPEVSHYSVSRAASIIGIGQRNIVSIAVDDQERMIPSELEKGIVDAKKSGKRIVAVIANACATTTGLYDPLYEIGLICKEHSVWYHIDGAHGASALISAKYKGFMKGVELADSMIWDTHKMLRTSTLAAAVLFKDTNSMINTFKQKGSYLFHEKENAGFDLMPYTIECTKAALATKLFWVLAAEGEKGMEKYLDHQYSIIQDFYQYFIDHDDYDCPYQPEANILCFRYNKGLESNAFQLALRNEIVKRGDYYITSAEFQEVRYLRFTVINERTSLSDIEELTNHISEIAPFLAGQFMELEK